MNNHRLLFIGGLHRSGTTMLARLLAEHPDVSGFGDTGAPADEGQHLQDVYPIVSHGRQAGRFALERNAHLTEQSPLVSDESRRRLWDAWRGHWDESRIVLIEKSPPNLLMTRFLQALFPDALFVVVIRHPVAVSAATQKWSSTQPHQLLRHWQVAHRTLRGDLPAIRNVILVQYEQLIADPDHELGRVFRFAGLEDSAAGRRVASGVNSDNFADDRTPRSGSNQRYFERWAERRRTLVRRVYLDLAERVVAGEAARFGYTMRPPGQRPPADPMVAGLLEKAPSYVV